MTPLAMLMLVAAQRREIHRTEKKVTIKKLHTWILSCRWSKESELYDVALNFLETRSRGGFPTTDRWWSAGGVSPVLCSSCFRGSGWLCIWVAGDRWRAPGGFSPSCVPMGWVGCALLGSVSFRFRRIAIRCGISVWAIPRSSLP